MKIDIFHMEYCIPSSRKGKNSSFKEPFITERQNIELSFHYNFMQWKTSKAISHVSTVLAHHCLLQGITPLVFISILE